MPRFIVNKLVRDEVLQRCLDDPKVRPEYRTLSGDELKKALLEKIHEETNEIPVKTVVNDEVLSEIADVQAALNGLKDVYGISDEDVRKAELEKRGKNGGFERAAFVESFDLDDDSEWVEHFRADPDKYKEIP